MNKNARVKVFCIFILLCFAGCSSKVPLPPVENHSFFGKPFKKNSPWAKRKAIRDNKGQIIVQKNDTIYAIARVYHLDLKNLIQTNKLHPPYILKVGQTLTPPKPHYHVVKKGETIYGISRLYAIQANRLVQLNSIAKPYPLSLGKKLILPSASYALGSTSKIASLSKNYKGVKNKRIQSRKKNVNFNKLPKRSSSRFAWPVKGKIISSYGAKPNGMHNDGVNIKAPYGAPVKVSENGIVAYAGRGIKSFGTLVLVKHANGWVSAYGHLKDTRIQRGQQLTKGQIIGTVGRKQNISQIHFELRRGKKALNPVQLMR